MIVAGVLCPVLLLIVALTTPRVTLHGGYDSDGMHYAAMAGAEIPEPNAGHVAPFGWRVLTPFLASLLPGSFLFRFRAIGVVSNWITLALVFEILRTLGHSMRSSIFGLLLYAGVFWTLKFSWYSPFYVDSQTQLFIVALTWLSLRKAYTWVLVLLPLAALQKESATVAGVFAIACHARDQGAWKAASWRYAALVVAASLVAVIGVRLAVGPITQEWTLTHVYQSLLMRPSLPAKLMMATVSGLGILVLLVPLHLRRSWRFLRERWEWGIYTLATLLLTLGGVDKSRLFLYALLPLTVVAVHVLDQAELKLSSAPVRIWLVVTLVIHLWLGWYLTPMGDAREYLLRMVPEWSTEAGWPPVVYYTQLAIVLGAWLAASLYVVRRTRSPQYERQISR
ncbi:MAG TPA: hypothetical protein VJY35_03950 [Candidatus Eisenbacteria bacterium]|nr:hypothetical protein [Candidatus Eisenbacteria bacterium]